MTEARFEATVLYAPGDGIGGSVLISAPNTAAQYLFNVPEGFSRLALEHRIRPSGRLACVLLGSIRPECAGGIGGLILRLAQDGHGQLQLFGPAGTEQYVHALRHIFHWRHPKVFACEFAVNRETPVFEDSDVVIVPLVADGGQTCCICGSQKETESWERSTSKRTGNQKLRWTVSNAKRDAVPELEEGANPVYSVDPSGDVSGIERTKTSGSVTTCLGYLFYMKALKTGLLLVDFRDSAAVSKLLVHPVLGCSLHQEQVVGAVVYLSPESAQLRERLRQKYPGVHHIRLGDGGGFQAPLETVAKLNLVDEKLFPLPLQCEDEFEEMSGRLLSRLIFERQASGFGVRIDHSMCADRFDFKHFQDDFLRSRPEVKQQLMKRSHSFIQGTGPSPNRVAAAAMRQKLSNKKEKLQVPPPAQLNSLENDFELLFLGTGCAEPSKYRGSSSILLRLHGDSSLLLDAGEGSVGQIQRRLGHDGAFRALASLRCLWLSHKHADHVLGTVSVIRSRQQESGRLVIVGPLKVGEWLTETKNACAMAGCSLPAFEFLHFEEFNALQRTATKEPSLLEQLQLRSMISVPVHHCHDAYGLVIFGRSEWSLVYSGDSRPCERLIQAGAGCTLLIHEATFEDSLEDHARVKRHSTVPEALQVGHRMQAGQVILTHFSQRYAKVVDIDSSRYENACMAFDGMFVASSRLSCLRQLLPLLKLVLSETRRTRQGKHEAAAASDADGPACKRQAAAICVPSIAQELPVFKRQHIRWLDSDSED